VSDREHILNANEAIIHKAPGTQETLIIIGNVFVEIILIKAIYGWCITKMKIKNFVQIS